MSALYTSGGDNVCVCSRFSEMAHEWNSFGFGRRDAALMKLNGSYAAMRCKVEKYNQRRTRAEVGDGVLLLVCF